MIQSSEFVGSLSWKAPELFEKNGRHSVKSDVYSLGIVFWELATGRRPWDDCDDSASIIGRVRLGDRPEIPSAVPDEFHQWICQSWHENPEERPTCFSAVGENLRRDDETSRGAAARFSSTGDLSHRKTKTVTSETSVARREKLCPGFVQIKRKHCDFLLASIRTLPSIEKFVDSDQQNSPFFRRKIENARQRFLLFYGVDRNRRAPVRFHQVDVRIETVFTIRRSKWSISSLATFSR